MKILEPDPLSRIFVNVTVQRGKNYRVLLMGEQVQIEYADGVRSLPYSVAEFEAWLMELCKTDREKEEARKLMAQIRSRIAMVD